MMRSLMCLAFLFYIALPVYLQANPLSRFSKEWEKPVYLQCNTAEHADYLTQKEKDMIYVLNMVRMNPQLFCRSVLKGGRITAFSIDTSSAEYYKSLVVTMAKMKPLGILKPDSMCTRSARAHATASGETAYTGHVRQTPESRKAAHFGGECCYYGGSEAVYVIVQLLVDEGIPTLGHRRVCLSPEFTKLGVGIAPHSSYGEAAVLDFGYK